MKRWPNIDKADVGLDFGGGAMSVGGAALANRQVFFKYDDDFIAHGLSLSPIKMKLDSEIKVGSSDLEGLPGLLHDSLPDGWSRLILDRHIRAQGYDHTSLGILDRLALVGAQGAGALTYHSPVDIPLQSPTVDFDTAEALVSNALEDTDADRIQAALALTGSLGGARPKAYAFLGKDGFSTSGTAGASPWILKFSAKNDGPEAGAVEYAYSLMAKAAGIDMPRTRLLPSKNSAGFFAVERFDRTEDGGRLHFHSFGGLLNAACASNALGYKELFMVTGALTHPAGTDIPSIEEQIRRMAFNVFARNRDDHVKNHAFLMDSGGAWRCAPAFDLTFSNLPEHALLVGNSGREPNLENMLEVARHVRIPDERTKLLIDQVKGAVGEWLNFAKEANVSASMAKDIDNALKRPPGDGGHGAAARFMRSRDSSLERN